MAIGIRREMGKLNEVRVTVHKQEITCSFEMVNEIVDVFQWPATALMQNIPGGVGLVKLHEHSQQRGGGQGGRGRRRYAEQRTFLT